MSDIIFYKYNIAAGILMGLCLGAIAPSLINRRQTPFIFSFGQISINVLLLSLIFHFNENNFLIALLSSTLCFALQTLSTKLTRQTQSIAYTTLFVVLYSINQVLITQFPQLQPYSTLHATGDLVTLTDSSSQNLILFCLIFLFFSLLFRKHILYLTFIKSTGLSKIQSDFINNYGESIFLFFSYFTLSVSNLYFGFLFTVGLFFIFSLLNSFSATGTLSYGIMSLVLMLFGLPGTFYLSTQADLTTVPSLLLICFCVLCVFELAKKCIQMLRIFAKN